MTTDRSATEEFLVRSYHWQRHRVRIRRASWCVPVVALLLAIFVPVVLHPYRDNSEPRPARADYVWVQMLPDGASGGGGRLVRAIVEHGSRCPLVVEKGQTLEMRGYHARVRTAFPILLCERELDADSEASIGPDDLPPRPTDPTAIAVIGDTGCRVTHFAHQPCHAAWPFQRIAGKVAAELAPNTGRSLIFHVGDFHYREKPCVDDDRGCGGSPFGDNWDVWKAEFFDPAKKLLLSAPWVIVRGNHENCARAGAGWLFFFVLPSQSFNGVCEDDLPAYHVNIGHTVEQKPRVLLVLDTANEGDEHTDSPEKRNKYRDWIADRGDSGTEVWLALHQPLWLLGHEEDTLPETRAKAADADTCTKDKTSGPLDVLRSDLHDAPRLNGRQRFGLILSGDTHLFQFFRPDEETDLPIQIIAGNGGTALDKLPCEADTPFRLDRSNVTIHNVTGAITAIARFGFVMLRPNGEQWAASLLDSTGRLVTTCPIGGGLPANGNPCTPTPEAQTMQSSELPLGQDNDDLASTSGIMKQLIDRWTLQARGFDWLGVIGVLAVLFAYAANQQTNIPPREQQNSPLGWVGRLRKWLGRLILGWRYRALNFAGASLILFSFWRGGNMPGIIIELAWALISIGGLIWILWRPSPPPGASGI
jgi:hypothetical protein